MAIRLAIVNDYEVVEHGLASMLRSYSDRVEVVEANANAHPVSAVDIALFDTFAQSFRDWGRIARLVSDPRIALPLSEVARVEAARTNTTVPALIGLGAAAILWRWIVYPALVGD